MKLGNLKIIFKKNIPLIVFVSIIIIMIFRDIYITKSERKKELKDLLIKSLSVLEVSEYEFGKYDSINIYIQKRDSIDQIIKNYPNTNFYKETISDLEYSINWYIKQIPRKRYFNYKRQNGIPLGYWEEDEEAHIENVEHEYNKTIEELLIEAKKELVSTKQDYKREIFESRKWNSKFNLSDLKSEKDSLQKIIEMLGMMNDDIAIQKNNIKNYRKELDLLE